MLRWPKPFVQFGATRFSFINDDHANATADVSRMGRSGFRVWHGKLCEFERFAMLSYRVIPHGRAARSKRLRAGAKAPESGRAPVALERLHEGRANAGRFDRLVPIRSIPCSIPIRAEF
jgi:hypothetical protein